MNKSTMIIKRVNEEAENFYERSQKLGDIAAHTFKEPQGKDRQSRHRSQLTGLENIAETTMKSSDVLDYIKKQIARQPGWTQPYGEKNERFGESLKSYIEKDLKDAMGRVSKDVKIGDVTIEDKRERQHIYLLLIRQFIRQVVVQYEYAVS